MSELDLESTFNQPGGGGSDGSPMDDLELESALSSLDQQPEEVDEEDEIDYDNRPSQDIRTFFKD